METSISKAKLFKACRRAYYFRYIEGLIPVKKSEALETGSSYHERIEALYSGQEIENDYSREAAMTEAYRKYIFPKLKVKAVEKWERSNIPSAVMYYKTHTLIGRVDGIAEDGNLVEHKTTSLDISEGGEYEYNLLWDEQILAYMFMTGTTKMYYTVCRKPTIRQKKTESQEEFYQRMVDWYDEDTDLKIRAFTVERTPQEIREWAEGMESLCDEMEAAEVHPERLYRNTCYCTHWGRRCEYSGICLNYNPRQRYVEYVKG